MQNQADVCIHCRKSIVFSGGAWIHTWVGSMFCEPSKGWNSTIGSPIKRTDRAEQQELAFV